MRVKAAPFLLRVNSCFRAPSRPHLQVSAKRLPANVTSIQRLLPRVCCAGDATEINLGDLNKFVPAFMACAQEDWKKIWPDARTYEKTLCDLQLRLRRALGAREWALAGAFSAAFCLMLKKGIAFYPTDAVFFHLLQEHFQILLRVQQIAHEDGAREAFETWRIFDELNALTSVIAEKVQFPEFIVGKRGDRVALLHPLQEPRDIARIKRFSTAAAAIWSFPFENPPGGPEEFLTFLSRTFWIDTNSVLQNFMGLAVEHSRKDPDGASQVHWTAISLQLFYRLLLYYAQLIGARHPLVGYHRAKSLQAFSIMSIEMIDQSPSRLFPKCEVAKIFDAFLPFFHGVTLDFSQTQVHLLNLMVGMLKDPQVQFSEMDKIRQRVLASLITDILKNKFHVRFSYSPFPMRKAKVLKNPDDYAFVLECFSALNPKDKGQLQTSWESLAVQIGLVRAEEESLWGPALRKLFS